GEIHSDPHPGNFIVMPDGRLGLVDFGSVKRFSPVFVAANTRMYEKSFWGQKTDVLATCREVGFSIDLPDAEAEPLIRELLHIAGRPMRAKEYDYGADTVVRE